MDQPNLTMNIAHVEPVPPTEDDDPGMVSRFGEMMKRQTSKRYAIRMVISIFCISLIILIVWFIYWPTHFGFDNSYSKTELGINGLYYWSTVTSTVGFGDICPKTINSKLFTVFYQMFMTVVGIGLVWELTDESVHYQLGHIKPRKVGRQ